MQLGAPLGALDPALDRATGRPFRGSVVGSATPVTGRGFPPMSCLRSGTDRDEDVVKAMGDVGAPRVRRDGLRSGDVGEEDGP